MEKISRIYLFGKEAIEYYNSLKRKPRTVDGIGKALESTFFEYMVVEREYTEKEHRAYVQGIMDATKYDKAMLIEKHETKEVNKENAEKSADPHRWDYY